MGITFLLFCLLFKNNILKVCLKIVWLFVHIQLEDQQTLEEAITMATAAIQHSGLTSDQWQLKITDAFLTFSVYEGEFGIFTALSQ